jgi:hypothetical protein
MGYTNRLNGCIGLHHELRDEPFASLLKGDLKTGLAGSDQSLLELVMATHTGMSTTQFEQIVKGWIPNAKIRRPARSSPK